MEDNSFAAVELVDDVCRVPDNSEIDTIDGILSVLTSQSCRQVVSVQLSSPMTNHVLGYQIGPLGASFISTNSAGSVNWTVCYVDNGTTTVAQFAVYTSADLNNGYHWHYDGNVICLESNNSPNDLNINSNLFEVNGIGSTIRPVSNTALAVEFNPLQTPNCLNVVNPTHPFTNFSFTVDNSSNSRSLATSKFLSPTTSYCGSCKLQ